jgi:hypothetical protein
MQGHTNGRLLLGRQPEAGSSRQASRAGGCRLRNRRFRLAVPATAVVVVVILVDAQVVPREIGHG